MANPPDDAPPTGAPTTDADSAEPGPAAAASTARPDRLAELKAKDLTRPAAELKSELSAAEISQLAAWFGLPSLDEAAAKPAATPQFDYFGRPVDLEARARATEQRERALAAVQPSSIGLLDRHLPAGDRLIIFRPDLEVKLDPRGFDHDLLTFAAREILEVDIPEVIADQMSKAVPQALLRDLHRPVDEFTIEYQVPSAEETSIDPLAESQAAMAASYRFNDAPHRALGAIGEALQPLKDAKASRWSEIRTPRRRVEE